MMRTEENGLHVENKSFIGMGLNPVTLKKGSLLKVHEINTRYRDRCDKSKICVTSLWYKQAAD